MTLQFKQLAEYFSDEIGMALANVVLVAGLSLALVCPCVLVWSYVDVDNGIYLPVGIIAGLTCSPLSVLLLFISTHARFPKFLMVIVSMLIAFNCLYWSFVCLSILGAFSEGSH